ncbi:anthranilate synthase, component I [Desulfatibacillum alkenivorans DSM 16219]|jgi:anthranilate synthase component 1|uniref:Anthranilate synthase component 1 n=1 Tax=Desulfatibacillum alkenivorans DSM 16219 TaxID=1121393 RepID=A0A1M6LZA1_9BACT|nr:anthranilate synthase component I family protein [Desulfatibacillum alkenivorans]SHJ76526.1 anthranilate synthase, component I [Desulfatibacillum alkenivorans DSM 16219]
MKLRCYPKKDEFLQLAQKGNVIPVCMEILADTETPVSVLLKKADANPAFLLESVEGGERWGRYSFLGTSAHAHVKVFAQDVEVSGHKSSQRIPHQGDPLSVLRDIMKVFNPVNLPDLPRFWGGMVGYLAYEMVSFFERIPHDTPADKPLAHFMITDELYVFDNVKHTLTMVAHVFLENGEDPAEEFDKAMARLESMVDSLSAPTPVQPETVDGGSLEGRYDPADYMNAVVKTKEYIKAGDIIQAVISQPYVCSAPVDAASLYRAQRYINPSPYMFFFNLDKVSLIGSSPETMVRLENGVATLRPIAGTRPRGKSQQEDRQLADDLLKDEKERAEHLMLVDLGRNDLGRVAQVGTVQVTDLMVVERYSHVMHLVSNITCDLLPECDGFDLLKASFPAGTLSGAPKVRAMEIIAELEKEPRGPYGGAVGYISFSGNMDLAITIRTAMVEDGLLTVRAGAGIVADSDPATEHQETLNKSKALERAISLIRKPAGEGIE